jgi:hypothetical protein
VPAVCPRLAYHPQRSRHEPLAKLVRGLLIALISGLCVDGGGAAATAPGLADSPGGTDMPMATNDASTANVVDADAFIVRDPKGRKRILIGNLWPAESGEWYPGVALYDEHGSERVCLLLGDAGPVLSFAEAGDTRLEIGCTNLDA